MRSLIGEMLFGGGISAMVGGFILLWQYLMNFFPNLIGTYIGILICFGIVLITLGAIRIDFYDKKHKKVSEKEFFKHIKDLLTKKKKLKVKQNFIRSRLLVIYGVIFIIAISYILISVSIFFNQDVLNPIIVSASLIVTLITGFMFQEYKDINILRREKLNRFVELQRKLLPYQIVFDTLSRQLRNKNEKIDFLLGQDYVKLRTAEFWEKNKNAYGIDFVRSLYELGSNHFNVPNFEKTSSIISKKLLENMHKAIIELSGVLARRKHYKYIFENLGIKENNDFSKIIIANESNFLKYDIQPLIQKYKGDWKSLDFWQLKIEEAADILEKMKSASRFIYSYNSKTITKFSKYLIMTSLFGILIPLLTISLTKVISSQIIFFLTTLSVIGFTVFFVLSLGSIYKTMNDNRIKIG